MAWTRDQMAARAAKELRDGFAHRYEQVKRAWEQALKPEN